MKNLNDILRKHANARKQSKTSELSDTQKRIKVEKNSVQSLTKFFKIIAGDKLNICYAETSTAYIDADRNITIPNYCFENKNLMILMGTHEVSHALYTPLNFYKNHNKEKLSEDLDIKVNKRFFNCINVVEDIRIEKMIRNKFPGLVKQYVKGYQYLFNNVAQFSIKSEKQWDEIGILGRINAHSKMGSILPYSLSDKEFAIYKYVSSAKTFEEVLTRSAYLYKLMLEEKEEEKEKENNNADDSQDSDDAGDIDDSQESDSDFDDSQKSDDVDVDDDGNNQGSDLSDADDNSDGNNQESGDADAIEDLKSQLDEMMKESNNPDDLLDKINDLVNDFEEKSNLSEDEIDEISKDEISSAEDDAYSNLYNKDKDCSKFKTTCTVKERYKNDVNNPFHGLV